MKRQLSLAIVGAALATSQLSAAAAPTPQSDGEAAAVKIGECAVSSATELERSGEPAETVADAAVASCGYVIEAAKVPFLAVATEKGGTSAMAEQLWPEIRGKLAAAARSRALLTAVQLRSTRNGKPSARVSKR